MLKDLFSKVKSIFSNIKIEKKITEQSVQQVSKKEDQTKVVKEDSSKKPIEILIHKPICEYSHGKRFKNGQPKWIVVHYTACISVCAKSMCKAMKNNTGASSHFYIDEKDIYSAVPLEYVAWHVGDGKCKQPSQGDRETLEELSNYKAKDWRYDLAAQNHLRWLSEGDDFLGNSQSIGVDICCKKKSTASKKATDTDWYFEKDAVDNTAKTVAYLATKYGISIDHVGRHCDFTGKLCPQPMTWPPEKGDAEWAKFKEKVAYYMDHGVIAKYI
jgi:N-acetylmuramoyl-L-alanine amidase CwlA